MTAAGTLVREVAKIACDILQAELGLDDAHCLLGNQPWEIPADKALFAVVFDMAGPAIGTTSHLDRDETSPTFGKEIQQSTVIHTVRVEIMSFDNDARTRKEEIGLAFASLYAQQLEGKYDIQIGRAQAPIDASDAEVTSRLLRFVVRVNITAMHQKVKAPPSADYFDKFNGATVDGSANAPKTETKS
jgi:hypothetical protein